MERTCLKSPGIIAICSFLLVNALFSLVALITEGELYDSNLLQNREVFKLIQTQADSCDILFMGSSVIEVPLSLLDGLYEYVPIPKKAQEFLSAGCGQKLIVKNFSIEAAQISDQFITIRKLIRDHKAPRIAVLAVVPRDFSDARLPEPEKTDTFRALVTLSDLEVLPLFFRTFDQYAQFAWTRLFPLYRYRTVITSAMTGKLRLFIDQQLNMINTSTLLRPIKTPQNKKILDQPLVNSDPHNRNQTDEKRAQRCITSLKEYKMAYSLLCSSSVPTTQLQFLRRFCQQCKNSNTIGIVLMLPLAKSNKELLPTGVYELYCNEVLKRCSEESTPCVDLSHSSDFSDDDFYDSAHLNASGGQKILNALIPQICKASTVKH